MDFTKGHRISPEVTFHRRIELIVKIQKESGVFLDVLLS
jgi:hypothetical protein